MSLSKWPFHGLWLGVTNHLLTGMILQVPSIWHYFEGSGHWWVVFAFYEGKTTEKPFEGWDHRWSSGSTQTMNLKAFSVWWLPIMKHRCPGHSAKTWPFWDGEDVKTWLFQRLEFVTSNETRGSSLVTLNRRGFHHFHPSNKLVA